MADKTTEAFPPTSRGISRPRLVVVEGPDAGSALDVRGEVRVGTSELADLRLTDRTVSRRHLTATPSELGVRIRDEDSRNGTWVGSTRVFDIELAQGTELRIGNTRIRLESSNAPDEPVAPDEESPTSAFGRFVGSARVVTPILRELRRVASTDVTVLIEGESGTGKELLAEALHDHSARAEGPFVVVDCGAVPPNLIESELFGHERGAFTGATGVRTGAFEQAQGGTVFLDEVGEMPLELQTRLLRALDRKQVRRLGGQEVLDVDVRVIAATNRNLEREVEASRFRLDLFHRLAVVMVRVPPLRERIEDVEALARTFLAQFGGDESLLTGEALARLRSHPWPGNVRELRNYVERLCLFGVLPSIDDAVPASSSDPFRQTAELGLPYAQARAAVLDRFRRAYVEEMLRRHDGNVSRAARAAGVARRHFQRLKQED